MDCDREIPVLAGWLNKVQNSGSIQHLNGNNNKVSKKKSATSKYCMLFDASQHGIERLEICESEQDIKNPTIVTLEDCVKITSEPSGEIKVWTKTGQLVLNAGEEQVKSWEHALKKVAFKEKVLKSSKRCSTVVADNDLYCSSSDESVYEVELMRLAPDVSERSKLKSNRTYQMELTEFDILLKDPEDRNVLAKWPYRFIRKYGYHDSHFFTFEAGRKCMTGEGVISLKYAKPKEIFNSVAKRMATMKSMIKSEKADNVDSSSDQLLAVVSQNEAGSRSPLTPEFETAITQSQLSMTRVAIGVEDSTASSSCSSKMLPTKPRKTLTLPLNAEEPKLPLARKPANDYASIKNIRDAWKTLGIDEPRHTERTKTPEQDLIEFSFHRSNSRNNSKTKFTTLSVPKEEEEVVAFSSKIVVQDDDGGYEHLDFLRSKSKISNGYEQISSLGGGKKTSVSTPTSAPDDYEDMTPTSEGPDTTAFRLADDSYLGYGKLRKFSPTTGLPPAPMQSPIIETANCFLDHSNYNGLNYAIVSKPKQV